MAEALGITGSVIAILQLTGKLASLGYEYIGGVKNAPEDLRQLVRELLSLSDILLVLQGYIQNDKRSTPLQLLNGHNGPISGCILELKRLQLKLEPKAGLQGKRKYLMWPLKERETMKHISQLERHKGLFTLALTADQLTLSREIEKYVQDTNIVVHNLQAESSAHILISKVIEGYAQDTNAVAHNIQAEVIAQSTVVQKIQTESLERKRKNILSWLSRLSTDDFDKRHLEISSKRQENTGQWLFREPKFRSWINKYPDFLLLWGYGIPGAGKTFLSSMVVDHLDAQFSTSNDGVAYIYFDYTNRDRQKPINILATLIRQLASRISDSTSCFSPEIEELYDKLQPQEKNPTWEELYTTLLVISRKFDRVFLVFDALDECDQDDQRKYLLPLLHLLIENGISLFVTSRPHPEDIQYSLRKAPRIELSAKEEDIRVYIRQRIDENPRANRLVGEGQCRDKLIVGLASCAKGMFLQARFHVEQICQKTTVRQILTELEKLRDLSSSISTEERPLDPTYDRAMDSIRKQPPSCTSLALRILSWLVKARHTLTVEELQEAVSVEPGQRELDKWNLPDKTTLLDVCAGLVTIDESSKTIRLAHYTIQEYLLRNRSLLENANLIVATACTTYLSFDIFAQNSRASEGTIGTYPFLSYAARYLLVHLKACDCASTTYLLLDFFKRLSKSNFYLCLEMFELVVDSDHETFYAQLEYPLHAASGIGHPQLVQLLIENGHDPSGLDGCNRTALHVAASRDYQEVLRLLLEKGVETSVRDHEGMTALHAAAAKGHKRVVQLLLENGADISSHEYQTVLHKAVSNHNYSVVQLLLDSGAQILATEELGRTAIHEAASKSHYEILSLLLEKTVANSDVAFQDDLGRTALHLAAGGYRIEIVQLLLDRMDCTSIGIQDNKGFTALHRAIHRGLPEVVELLLDKGADISVQNKKGSTALHVAAYRGRLGIVELLLDKGAEISTQNANGFTALHAAGYEMHIEVVKRLLDRGADVSVQDNKGFTVLHAMAYEGQIEVVRLLLDKGADVSVQNKKGSTALHAATSRGHLEVVKLLLDNGADLSVQDANGFTVLHVAAYEMHVEVVKLLLDRGADFSVLDSKAQTAIQKAIFSSEDEIMQLLHDRGADISIPDLLNSIVLHEAVTNGDSQESVNLGYKALDRLFEMVKADLARGEQAMQQVDSSVQCIGVGGRGIRPGSEAPEKTESREDTPENLRNKRPRPDEILERAENCEDTPKRLRKMLEAPHSEARVPSGGTTSRVEGSTAPDKPFFQSSNQSNQQMPKLNAYKWCLAGLENI